MKLKLLIPSNIDNWHGQEFLKDGKRTSARIFAKVKFGEPEMPSNALLNTNFINIFYQTCKNEVQRHGF